MKLTANLKNLGGSLFAKRPADSKRAGAANGKSSTKPTDCKNPATAIPPPTTRPRVSFRDSDDLVQVVPALGNDEYDRAPIEDHTRDPERENIYDELIDYVEHEMLVHSSMQYTVKHEFLYGKTKEMREHTRRTCVEANNMRGTDKNKRDVSSRAKRASSSSSSTPRPAMIRMCQ